MVSNSVAKSVDSLRFCRVDASLEGGVEAEDFDSGGCRGKRQEADAEACRPYFQPLLCGYHVSITFSHVYHP